jgi:hypothetical protein
LTDGKENFTIKKTFFASSFEWFSIVIIKRRLTRFYFGSFSLAARSEKKIVLRESGLQNYRRPFWMPAPAYYILTFGVAVAVFLLVWGILHEGEDLPWVLAGMSACVTIFAAVVAREIFLRQSRNRFLMAQRRLDQNLRRVSAANNHNPNKLTLEKNALLLKEIEKKSEAAKILGKLADAHFDVFEICHEYLQRTERELETIAPGSPRLAAIRRGREKVSVIHREHLLNWAALESKSLTQEANIRVTIGEKLETAQKALVVLETALQFYPAETQLRDSAAAVQDFIASMKISNWIEQAERAAFKGNYKRAVSHYRDALFYLGRENVRNAERDLIAEKINLEIENLRELQKNETNRKISQNSREK